MNKRLQEISGFAVILFLSACGGGGDTTAPSIGPVATVSVSAPSSAVVIGGSLQLTASPSDAAGHAVTGQTITWTSSNQAVATVSSSGLVSGLSSGSVTITATDGTINGTTQLTVAPAGLAATVQAGVVSQFTPAQVDIAAGGTVTWQFSTVTHNVTFTGTGAGTPANTGDQTSTSVSRSFSTVGTFAYECTIHPGMTGKVVVH